MQEATEHGLNTNDDFKSKYFIKQTEKSDNIYLNETELKEMQNLDLSDNEKLDNVRDMFLIACWTGQRIGDYTQLKPKNIADGFIRVNQAKGDDKSVIIPIHDVVKSILKKRNGDLPRKISDQKFNQYLKDVGQLMPSLQKTEDNSNNKRRI